MFLETFLKIPQQASRESGGFVHPSANSCIRAFKPYTQIAQGTQNLQKDYNLSWPLQFPSGKHILERFYFILTGKKPQPNSASFLLFFLMSSVMRVKVWIDKQKREHSWGNSKLRKLQLHTQGNTTATCILTFLFHAGQNICLFLHCCLMCALIASC